MIEAINNNNRIKSLDWGQNHLGFFDNFKLLCKMLLNNKNITYLNLTYNNLSTSSLELLCESLNNNKTITILDLGWNEIGSDELGQDYPDNVDILRRFLLKNETISLILWDGNCFSYEQWETMVPNKQTLRRVC